MLNLRYYNQALGANRQGNLQMEGVTLPANCILSVTRQASVGRSRKLNNCTFSVCCETYFQQSKVLECQQLTKLFINYFEKHTPRLFLIVLQLYCWLLYKMQQQMIIWLRQSSFTYSTKAYQLGYLNYEETQHA